MLLLALTPFPVLSGFVRNIRKDCYPSEKQSMLRLLFKGIQQLVKRQYVAFLPTCFKTLNAASPHHNRVQGTQLHGSCSKPHSPQSTPPAKGGAVEGDENSPNVWFYHLQTSYVNKLLVHICVPACYV